MNRNCFSDCCGIDSPIQTRLSLSTQVPNDILRAARAGCISFDRVMQHPTHYIAGFVLFLSDINNDDTAERRQADRDTRQRAGMRCSGVMTLNVPSTIDDHQSLKGCAYSITSGSVLVSEVFEHF